MTSQDRLEKSMLPLQVSFRIIVLGAFDQHAGMQKLWLARGRQVERPRVRREEKGKPSQVPDLEAYLELHA